MRIAINGFGRIGRLTFRQLLQREDLEVVAINDLSDTKTLAHLLQYDSVHGKLPFTVKHAEEALVIDDRTIKVFSQKDPAQLPWGTMEIDLVIECTGIFRDREGMHKHIQAGAGKVLLSAPAKGEGVKTIVLGVNDADLQKEDRYVSNASCTTNCLAPMVKILNDTYGIEKGYMTTIHAYTADQNLQDAPHADLRRARAAALSIVPTTTGAAQAVSLVIPNVKGKLDGLAMRVPTPTGSVTDLTVILSKEVSREEVNMLFKTSMTEGYTGIMGYTDAPLVSADIVGDTHSCIFDSELTATEGNLVKVVGWYDNEAGYSARLADLAERIGKL